MSNVNNRRPKVARIEITFDNEAKDVYYVDGEEAERTALQIDKIVANASMLVPMWKKK